MDVLEIMDWFNEHYTGGTLSFNVNKERTEILIYLDNDAGDRFGTTLRAEDGMFKDIYMPSILECFKLWENRSQ